MSCKKNHAGGIPTWMAETFNQPEPDRIVAGGENDRDRRSCCLRRQPRKVCRWRPEQTPVGAPDRRPEFAIYRGARPQNGTRPRHSARLRSQHPLALSELAFVTRLRHDMTSASSGYLFVLQMSAFDLKRTWPFQHCSSIRYDELFLSPGAEGGVATWPLCGASAADGHPGDRIFQQQISGRAAPIKQNPSVARYCELK